jgi:hypothetical protein
MNHEITYRFQYTSSEIISAHRLRFLHGNQLRIVSGIGLVVEVYLIAQQLFPQALNRPAGANWGTPIGLAILIVGLPLLAYIFSPLFDYRFNPDWKKAFTLFLSKEAFRIYETSGETPGIPIKWFRVKRVLENKKVFVMILGSERVFIIIPRRLFENQEQKAFFQDILAKRTSAKSKKELE